MAEWDRGKHEMKLEEKQVRNLELILGTIRGVCRESRLAIGSQLGGCCRSPGDDCGLSPAVQGAVVCSWILELCGVELQA